MSGGHDEADVEQGIREEPAVPDYSAARQNSDARRAPDRLRQL